MVKKTSGGNCNYTSGTTFQTQNVGDLNTQYNRVMDSTLGNNATRTSNSINTISNVNADNNWSVVKGGRKKGGFIGPILQQGLAPATLFLAQQNLKRPFKTGYRGKKSFRKTKRRGGSFINTLLPPLSLYTANHIFGKSKKQKYTKRNMKKTYRRKRY